MMNIEGLLRYVTAKTSRMPHCTSCLTLCWNLTGGKYVNLSPAKGQNLEVNLYFEELSIT